MNRFIQILSEIEDKVFQCLKTNTHAVFPILWPVVQQILIDTDKNRDLMTPNALYGNLQKFVAIFTAACRLDSGLNLSDADMFRNYALAPYNYMDVYPRLKEGMRLSFLINEKVDKIIGEQPYEPKVNNKLEAPYIEDDQLYQTCKTSVSTLPIVNNVSGATVYYSIDGSKPTKPVTNGKVRIKNTFHPNKEKEEDQECIVKLKAVLNDAESDVSTFTVILHKAKDYIRI